MRNIPPAPRRLRLRPLLAHRWPLWALGAIPTAVGVMVAWAMFLQSGGKFSLGPTLDRGPVETATAVVRQVNPPVDIDGRRREEVVYELRFGPQQVRLSEGQASLLGGALGVPSIEHHSPIACGIG